MADRAMDVSRALAPLRDVVASLGAAAGGAAPSGNDRRRIVRRVRAAGAAALPALARALVSANAEEAAWAGYLLIRLGGGKVVERLSQILEEPRTGSEARARVESVLAEVASPTEGSTERQLAESVAQLLGSIAADGDLTLALDLITRQVPEEEVVSFAAEVARHGGRMSLPLLEGMAAAGVWSDDAHRSIDELRDIVAGQAHPTLRARAGEALRRQRTRDRGLGHLEKGDLRRARRSLAEAVRHDPDDAELRSYLGVCLLQLGEHEAALEHLERAVAVQPKEALHHWNLAAAAKAGEQPCRAYLALRSYLKLPDETDGWEERRQEARRFTRSYARLIPAMHPGVPLPRVVEGERRFVEAFGHLAAERFAEARAGFEEVVELLPNHYPSWGNLGAALIGLGETRRARRALQRALTIKPDYETARENLRLLQARK